jgi:hypothetical protein
MDENQEEKNRKRAKKHTHKSAFFLKKLGKCRQKVKIKNSKFKNEVSFQ